MEIVRHGTSFNCHASGALLEIVMFFGNVVTKALGLFRSRRMDFSLSKCLVSLADKQNRDNIMPY